MAPSSSSTSSWGVLVSAVVLASSILLPFVPGASAANWCVARSHVSQQQLQTALDYACGAGADCAPIQPDGLCYLPNTIEAHASYAFNSLYQRKGNAPGSCDFADTAAVASTDPSYGSCAYPSSASTAGAFPAGTLPTSPGTNGPTTTATATPTTTNTPSTDTPAFDGGSVGGSGSGGFNPLGPTDTNSDESRAAPIISVNLIALSLIWVATLLFSPM